MKKMIQLIVSIIALTVMAPGHAKEVSMKNDLDCLARNIYYEAGNEPEEGKVAVGLVTINRSNSGDFPKTICGVVNQKTAVSVAREVTQTRTVTEGLVFKTTRQVKERVTVWTNRVVCQFSWRCENVRNIKTSDTRWEDSMAVARELLDGGYEELRFKYRDALYFHNRTVRPDWSRQKIKIERIGGHIFYANRFNKGLLIAEQ